VGGLRNNIDDLGLNSHLKDSDPQQWMVQPQQAHVQSGVQRYDMFALASFDLSSLPFETYI
jgi:hypothetical protein